MTTGCPRDRGFSLLEIMVALAILAMALVLLSEIATSNVRATHHARLLTTATFLARSKMADLEDVVLEEGFVENDREEDGDFTDAGRPEFRWKTVIEKIQLPVDMAQQAQEANQSQVEEGAAGSPLAAMAGFMGGFMTTLIEPIRVGIEESVRRVTVHVYWDEPGRPVQTFSVETFMTDPAKLDMAVAAIGQPPGGANQGQGGAAGSPGGSGAGGSSGGGRPPNTPTTPGGRR